ncbi:MAG: TonB-dependent receptor plug domain-containing protein, partial [Bacteroidota bacterium]
MQRKLYLLLLGLTLMATTGMSAQAMASALTGSWVAAEPQPDQRKVEKVRLDVALDLLSDHYRVLFNYYPELVSPHETSKPSLTTPNVEEALRRVLRRTGLGFMEVGEKNFVIAPTNDLKELRRAQTRPAKRLDPKSAPAAAPTSIAPQGDDRRLSKRLETLVREAPDEVVLATVRGTVTDENGPLIGVTVRSIEDPSKGAITDLNGEYSLDLPVLTGSLLFTYTGYESQTVAINNRTVLDVQMRTSSELLEEVVVIGYGERSSKDLTGSVSAVGAREIEKSPLITTESALQGRLAGVYISTPGGDPTARPEVQIRGVGTFGSAEPLYVIDGVPITEFGSGSAENDPGAQDLRGSVNILSFVNPADIASVSVLKDASAA